MSQDTVVNVKFDIYDVEGKPISNQLKLEWTAQYNNNTQSGYNGSFYNTSSYNGDEDVGGLIESFDGATDKIRNFQRIKLHITNNDKLPHTVNWCSLLTTEKNKIRRRKLTKIT